MRKRDAIEKAPCSSEPWADEIFSQKLRCSSLYNEMGRQRKESELPCSVHGYVYFYFSFCHTETMEVGNIKVIHIALLHIRLCLCCETYKHINKLHHTSNLPSFPFPVLTSFLTLHFNALWIPQLDSFADSVDLLPLPGSLAQPLVACDWQMKLGSCVLTLTPHWSQGWEAFIRQPLCRPPGTHLAVLICISHIQVSKWPSNWALLPRS